APCVEAVDDIGPPVAVRVAGRHEGAVPPRRACVGEIATELLEARAVEDADLCPGALACSRDDLVPAVAVHISDRDADAVLVGRVGRELERVRAPWGNLLRR